MVKNKYWNENRKNINNEDKNKHEMNIIVYNMNNTIIKENISIKQSEDIICTKCKNNILIKIEEY